MPATRISHGPRRLQSKSSPKAWANGASPRWKQPSKWGLPVRMLRARRPLLPRTMIAGSHMDYLANGTKLVTLRDAANLFATQFETVKSWRLLELAIERLIDAAESAERDTVKIATDSIEHLVMMAKPKCLT